MNNKPFYTQSDDVKQSRREFLKSLSRSVILAIITGAGSMLFFKRRFVLQNEHICTNQAICRGCTRFKDCILPQALSEKIQS